MVAFSLLRFVDTTKALHHERDKPPKQHLGAVAYGCHLDLAAGLVLFRCDHARGWAGAIVLHTYYQSECSLDEACRMSDRRLIFFPQIYNTWRLVSNTIQIPCRQFSEQTEFKGLHLVSLPECILFPLLD